MTLIIVLILVAVIVGFAVGRASGNADEQSNAMWAEMEREQADAEAWERITR